METEEGGDQVSPAPSDTATRRRLLTGRGGRRQPPQGETMLGGRGLVVGERRQGWGPEEGDVGPVIVVGVGLGPNSESAHGDDPGAPDPTPGPESAWNSPGVLDEKDHPDNGEVLASEHTVVDLDEVAEPGESTRDANMVEVVGGKPSCRDEGKGPGPGHHTVDLFFTDEGDAGALVGEEAKGNTRFPVLEGVELKVHGADGGSDSVEEEVRRGVEQGIPHGRGRGWKSARRVDEDDSESTHGREVTGRHEHLKVV